MRIQHNILAMNSYRSYNNNTSGLSKNLEKLSSGYKINRAGDDAAGLAISEKMRAQIQGLNAAQKNVKDAISFVKTAEGAMQEIQDMLSRMKYLATQSANGTYQDDIDREALQDEVNSLLEEIDRIADSANFNGIYMLNGGDDGGTPTGGSIIAGNTPVGAGLTESATAPDVTATVGVNLGEGALTEADMSAATILGDVTDNYNAASMATESITITIDIPSGVAGATEAATQVDISITFTTDSEKAGDYCIYVSDASSISDIKDKIQQAVMAKLESLGHANSSIAVQPDDKAGIYATGFTLGDDWKSGTVTFKEYVKGPDTPTATDTVPTGTKITMSFDGITGNFSANETVTINGVEYTFQEPGPGSLNPAAGPYTVDLGTTLEQSLQNLVSAMQQNDPQGTECGFTVSMSGTDLVFTLVKDGLKKEDVEKAFQFSTTSDVGKALQKAIDDAIDKALDGGGGESYSIKMQIGDSSKKFDQMEIKIKSMKTDSLGIKGLSISNIDDAAAAISTIKDAINDVSSTRGELGAYQNRLEHTANNLSVMTENIQDAESTIRDTDVAEEMMSYVKNNILVQSAQAMLAQANQVPQGVLQLLG